MQCPFEMICKKHNGEPKMFDAVVNEAEGRIDAGVGTEAEEQVEVENCTNLK